MVALKVDKRFMHPIQNFHFHVSNLTESRLDVIITWKKHVCI